MKNILFTVALASVAGIAVAADSTQFGVLKVPSTAEKTIVAVPWLESTTTDKAVAVSNLVLTAGLTKGDLLKWYDSSTGKYKSWVLNGDDVLYWEAVVNADENDTGKSENADKQGIDRGEAIILTRQTHTDGFHIMGKPATSESGSIELPASGWTLIAPYKVEEIKFSDLHWTGLSSFTDHLIVDINGTRKELNWANSKWYDISTGKEVVDFAIPAGLGMWFWSESDASGKSVSWD